MTEQPFARHPAGPQHMARQVIDQAMGRVQPPQPLIPPSLPVKLTEDEQKTLDEAVAADALCKLCSSVHAGAELACPRLASFTLDRDGKLQSGEFWPEGAWTRPRMTLGEDPLAEGEGSDDGPAG